MTNLFDYLGECLLITENLSRIYYVSEILFVLDCTNANTNKQKKPEMIALNAFISAKSS